MSEAFRQKVKRFQAAPRTYFGEPPPGYVAGLGRGAVGFAGTSSRVVRGQTYTKEDDEADDIFDAVDKRMKNRKSLTKRQRDEALMKKPTVADQFKDLKQEMSAVSADEWANIPEIGDYTVKKRKVERYMPVPEKLIMEKVRQNQPEVSAVQGLWTVRDQILGSKLNTLAADADGGAEGGDRVNKEALLHGLDNVSGVSNNIGDMKKARAMFAAVRENNPQYSAGWIAAARLEESAGKIVAARKIIQQGCQTCPNSEDVWIEAAKLEQTHNAKIILAQATKSIPTSVLIWEKAAELEDGVQEKKLVLRKALMEVPASARLWKSLVGLEQEDDSARVLLAQAVKCVPDCVDLWLALAKLEKYQQARKVLNQARGKCSTDVRIYIAAAHLEEVNENEGMVEKIIQKCFKAVGTKNTEEDWLQQAVDSEKLGCPCTACAIVRVHIARDAGDMSEEASSRTAELAKTLAARGAPAAARAVYAHVLSGAGNKDASAWIKASSIEETFAGKRGILSTGLKQLPNSLELWNSVIELEEGRGEANGIRETFEQAIAANPATESFWTRALAFEAFQTKDKLRIESLYRRATAQIPKCQDVYIIVAAHEKSDGSEAGIAKACKVLETGRGANPAADRVWIESIKMAFGSGNQSLGQQLCSAAIKLCPGAPDLYMYLADSEKRTSRTKARSTLEMGRFRNPSCDRLWLHAVKLERALGNVSVADNMMAKAFQACPKSGLLHADKILTAPKVRRKGIALGALKLCENSPHVMLAVSKMFLDNMKHAKAKKWYERAAKLDKKVVESAFDGLGLTLRKSFASSS